MKKFSFLMSLLVTMVLLSSCTHRVTDFTIISTRNVPLGKNATTLAKGDTRVKADDTTPIILYFPIGRPDMKEAIDKALEKYHGAVALADGVVYYRHWWFILFGQNSYIVEGTPIFEAEASSSEAAKESVEEKDNEKENLVVLFHEVKKNETLSTIAETYKVTLGQILKWNELSTPEVPAGTKLKLYVK
ncbi:MAG: LysM peptidoglycan-binding domain-containing protein [Bacteroidaceae bacterium]|nr:LysM peptidoglycan-binding domain-containing protein [Bacteroidaceae bacterium]